MHFATDSVKLVIFACQINRQTHRYDLEPPSWKITVSYISARWCLLPSRKVTISYKKNLLYLVVQGHIRFVQICTTHRKTRNTSIFYYAGKFRIIFEIDQRLSACPSICPSDVCRYTHVFSQLAPSGLNLVTCYGLRTNPIENRSNRSTCSSTPHRTPYFENQ